MRQRKILFVLTGHDRLGASGDTSADKTGFHLAEAAQPWQVLTKAGYEIDIATPDGGKAPIDPSSYNLDDDINRAFATDERVRGMIENSAPLASMDLSAYEAIYFPGGHGTMWDLPNSEAVKSAVSTMYNDGKVVAAVCHGPAALVNVKLANGKYLVDGKTLSVFTDSEERAVEKADAMPFLLASKLEERGATIKSAEDFASSVSVDGRLVTGQNPSSARGVGEAIRDVLDDKQSKAA